jgi:hypothetical protein
MARDWTIGVDITDIVGVAEGDADNNDAIAVIATTSGIWSGSDIMTLATLSFTPIAAGASCNNVLRISAGKFAVTTENGKIYELTFATPSSDPVVSLVHTDAGGLSITAIAHAAGRNELVFGAGTKVYTIPVGGGVATERADGITIAAGGGLDTDMVFDLDYSPEGWVLIFAMSDGSKVTAVATEDWATIDTENLPAALSASTPLQVNFTEETSTWMVARADGELVTTTALDDWRAPAGASAVWVAVGHNGHVATNDNLTPGDAWDTYIVPNSSDHIYALGYGKDENGTEIFMMGTTDNIDSILVSSAPLDGAGTWTATADPGNVTGLRGLAFSDYGSDNSQKVWVGGGSSGEIIRFTNGAWSNYDLGTDNIWDVATDGGQNWVVATSEANREFAYWKSTDNGATFARSYKEAWVSNADNFRKSVGYGNGVWVATNRNRIHAATDANFASNTWTLAHTATDHINDVQYGADNKWMAIGHARDVYISTDNGSTWSQATDIPGSDEPMSVAYSGGTWVVVTNGTANNILVSTDHGTSWSVAASTGGALARVAVNSILPNS